MKLDNVGGACGQGGERGAWETHRVRLTRVPGYGFGIAVSGGRDNPHFASGDPAIAVSDVLRAGPAEEKLQVNDRIVSVNGILLDNVEYARAVQVLRDSGSTVSLVVRRRAPPPPTTGTTPTPQTIKITLNKASKKEDFGLVLGCKLFIKELTPKARDQLNSAGQSLAEGDILTRINNTNCADGMSLKEARKIIDSCKERLNLVVARDTFREATVNNQGHHGGFHNNYGIAGEGLTSAYSGQNLYVAAPSRSTLLDDRLGNSMGSSPAGRTRGPLPAAADVSQLDAPSGPDGVLNPPRPPPPRPEDYYSSRRQLYEDENAPRNKPPGEPRLISFQKEGSVGLRLTGGNRSGVFVSAVQPGSPAALQGLQPGDKILKVNEMEMKGVTREEAVLFLLSLQERIDLIVQHSPEEYNAVAQQHMGDSFHIKCHFHYTEPTDGEMSFRSGDVFHVVDTLHNGTVGAWQVYRIGRNNQEVQKGIIPNKARAEELATAQFNATKKEMSTNGSSESRGNFFKRRRSTHRRSKSLGKEHWDDVVFSDSISKFPAYERVVLKHPGFVRPVVLFGPVADMAREKLLRDHPDKFSSPLMDESSEEGKKTSGITRLSGIRAIMDRGKHALLDITPNAVDRLNYAQFYPVVIFLKAEHKHTIKQLRQGIPKSAHKSSKKLLEQCQRLEKVWGHVFTQTITLNDTTLNTWYTKLNELIQRSQAQQLWVSETKRSEPLSDDFLFPMSASNESRLSYASSPESDLDVSPPPQRLAKASSDPSVATAQDNVDRADDLLNLPMPASPTESVPPPYTTGYTDSKYGFSSNGNPNGPNSGHPGMPSQNGHGGMGQDGNGQFPRNPLAHSPPLQGQPGLYGTVPELPPRLDRGPGGGSGKPVGGVLLPAMGPIPPGQVSRSHQHSLRQQQTQIHRLSAQERLFGSSKTGDSQDETGMYGTRTSNPIGSTPSNQNPQQGQGSLDRHRHLNNNNSYDSMSSSYDAYSTHQPGGMPGVTGGGLSNSSTLALSATRLGPNVPDDLKAGPLGKYDPIPPPSMINAGVNGSPQRSSNSDHNSMDGSNYQMGYRGGRPAGGPNLNPMPPHSRGPSLPAVPVNSDYNKYSSRTNSASTADYSPSRPLSGGPLPMSQCAPPGPPAAPSYKPVPPPKPKHYRPPSGEQQHSNGSHHHAKSYSVGNGSMEMMNGRGGPHNGPHNGQGQGFYGQNQGNWAPTHAHSHSHPHPGQHHAPNHQQYHHQGGYGGGPPQSPPYSGPPSHPGHPRSINLPHNSHLIDLAGSREQRGSAFELYKKPQHMHNMSQIAMMNVSVDHENAPMTPKTKKKLAKKSSFLKNAVLDLFRSKSKKLARQRSLCESSNTHKETGGSAHAKSRGLFRSNSTCDKQLAPRPILKRQSSFCAERNSCTVTDYDTVPVTNLRRPGSLCDLESETKLRPVLRRQNSLIEYNRRGAYNVITAIDPIYQQRNVEITHEPFHPTRPYPTEHIYDPIPKPQRTYTSRFVSENPYATKRELMEDPYSVSESPYSTREHLLRQRLFAECPYATREEMVTQRRSSESPYTTKEDLLRQRMIDYNARGSPLRIPNCESPYASKSDIMCANPHESPSLLTSITRCLSEPPYTTKAEMTARLNQLEPRGIINPMPKPEATYVSRQEILNQKAALQRESPYATKQQMDDKFEIIRQRNQAKKEMIYQTRKEANDCGREPLYVSKRELKDAVIYESQHEANASHSVTRRSPYELSDMGHLSRREPVYQAKSDLLPEVDFTALRLSESKTDYEKRSNLTEQANVLAGEPLYQPRLPTYESASSVSTNYTAFSLNFEGKPQSTPYTSQDKMPVFKSNRSVSFQDKIAENDSSENTITPNETTVMERKGEIDPDNPHTVWGVFDSEGGVLEDRQWGVSLVIPPKAIAPGIKQKIYFTVTDPRLSQRVGGPPIDMDNGEAMLSPLVMCGPQGLVFLRPVTLRLPHCANAVPSLGLTLKATDTEAHLSTDWDNIHLPATTTINTVAVKVDHF